MRRQEWRAICNGSTVTTHRGGIYAAGAMARKPCLLNTSPSIGLSSTGDTRQDSVCTDTTFGGRVRLYEMRYNDSTMPRTPPTKSRQTEHPHQQTNEMTCRSVAVKEQPRPSNGEPEPDPIEDEKVAFIIEGVSEESLSDDDADEVKQKLREWLVTRGYPAMESYIDNGELY